MISFKLAFGIGAVIGAIGAVLAAVIVLVIDGSVDTVDTDEFGGSNSGAIVLGMLVGAGLIAVAYLAMGFASGWFGRDRDTPVVAAVGTVLGTAAVLLVVSVAAGAFALPIFVLPVVIGFAAAFLARTAWFVGNLFCDGPNRPEYGAYVAPAYPSETPGHTPFTTTAGPALRRTMDELAEWLAPGAPVQGRAVGIVRRLPRDQIVVVVLAADRLALAPVNLEGTPVGEAQVLTPPDLAQVSIISRATDGSERRHINAFDDTITVVGRDGVRVRFALPYGTRGAGTTTGGPDVILDWLRTNAATYV